MSEYMGNEHAVALQKAIRSRATEIAANPLLANGGRILNILDPDAYGWANVVRDAERDGFIGLTMVDRDSTLSQLNAQYGNEVEFPYWEAFTGNPDSVLVECSKVISETELPKGWVIKSHTHPDETIIHQSQVLNQENGVAPTPAYYLRGEQLPSMLTCLLDNKGNMAACASATMRYHSSGPLSNWLFAGGVSVNPEHRRMGLGSYVNAKLLEDSQNSFEWSSVLEQAKSDNAASVGMIKRCGLRRQPGKVTIVINTQGGYLTR